MMLMGSQEDISDGWVAWPEESPFVSDDRPTILVAGNGYRQAWLRRIAARAGLRPIGRNATAVDGAIPDLLPDLMLLDLRGAEGMAWLRQPEQTGADLTRLPLSVLVDLDGLEEALALLDGPETDILCEPSESDIISMLVLAGLRQAEPKASRMNDVAHDREVARLEKLSEEVRRLASTIERLSTPDRPFLPGSPTKESDISYRPASHDQPEPAAPQARSREPSHGIAAADQPLDHVDIRALIRARRLRDEFLPADLFADPAWDMLLDLLGARLADRRVSVSSLCIAAAVPPTTALRWIRQLTDRGIFIRIDDPLDGRRVFIDLTDKAADAMLGWVQAVRRKGGVLAAPAR